MKELFLKDLKILEEEGDVGDRDKTRDVWLGMILGENMKAPPDLLLIIDIKTFFPGCIFISVRIYKIFILINIQLIDHMISTF